MKHGTSRIISSTPTPATTTVTEMEKSEEESACALDVSLASGGGVVPVGWDSEPGGWVAVVPVVCESTDGECGSLVAVVAGRGPGVPGWDSWAELEGAKRGIEVVTISGS